MRELLRGAILLCVLQVANASGDVTDLFPVESDRTIVEDVMDSNQPGWTFSVGGQSVKVAWTNGATASTVRVAGVAKTFYWYEDGSLNGYRCDDATWMKLHFDLGKNLVPVLLVTLDSSVGTQGAGYALGGGDSRMTYREMTTGGGMTIIRTRYSADVAVKAPFPQSHVLMLNVECSQVVPAATRACTVLHRPTS